LIHQHTDILVCVLLGLSHIFTFTSNELSLYKTISWKSHWQTPVLRWRRHNRKRRGTRVTGTSAHLIGNRRTGYRVFHNNVEREVLYTLLRLGVIILQADAQVYLKR